MNADEVLGLVAVVIAYVVAFFVSWWKIFEKGGEEGWAVFVPFYNAYILGKVAGGVSFGIGFLVVVIIKFFGILIWLVARIAADEEIAYIVFLIVFIFAIPFLIMRLVLAFKLGGKFGRGVGFRFLLCLSYINAIPYLYLAFSKNCVYSEKPKEASVGLFVVLIPMAIFFDAVPLAVTAVPRFVATRTDAQIATARSDLASAQKAIVAKVFADNIDATQASAPDPNKPVAQQSYNWGTWGEWIIEVAGLNENRWKSFGAGIYPIDSKTGEICYNKSEMPLLWINPRDGTMHFNPSELSDNYGKKKGFCETLRDSYVSDSGNGDKVIPLASSGTVKF